MGPIKIFIRVKDQDELEEIILLPVNHNTSGEDILWESTGNYFLEAFQCGTHPSICSIEKDPRIENAKEEIALLIVDEIKKTKDSLVTSTD